MLFIVCQAEDYQNILRLNCRPFSFTSSKYLKKNKRGLELVSCLVFWLIFEEKSFSCYILLSDQVSLSSCLYFVRYWAICVLQYSVNQAVTSKLCNWRYHSHQAVFSTWPKIWHENLNILRTQRELLRWNKKHFSSFLKSLHWSK